LILPYSPIKDAARVLSFERSFATNPAIIFAR
jgi:hypothetical protein